MDCTHISCILYFATSYTCRCELVVAVSSLVSRGRSGRDAAIADSNQGVGEGFTSSWRDTWQQQESVAEKPPVRRPPARASAARRRVAPRRAKEHARVQEQRRLGAQHVRAHASAGSFFESSQKKSRRSSPAFFFSGNIGPPPAR